ncbi:MAG: MBL fold metallo-hydrolase [Desulfobacterales bacterium]|nr:MBL fold metallo-hydrolase [Desulfobacterales bacterium]
MLPADKEIIQIKLQKMDTFCYMIADKASKTCALVDPAFNTDRVLKIISDYNYRVTHVINTHYHFDHTAGNHAIIAKTRAKLLIHEFDVDGLFHFSTILLTKAFGGKLSPRPDVLLQDNDDIFIGRTKIHIIHTPGHTTGGICIYVEGNLFTGDSLFVGNVGRTDLYGSSESLLLSSIQSRIYTLPDKTIIWPGHDYGEFPYSTVDYERKNNPFTKRLRK